MYIEAKVVSQRLEEDRHLDTKVMSLEVEHLEVKVISKHGEIKEHFEIKLLVDVTRGGGISS